MPSLPSRQTTYYQLSTAPAHLKPAQVKTLIQKGDSAGGYGWGINHTITVGKSKVFVKSVPVTGLEYAHPSATKNLYDLPTYYNYGVGSTGFGVWRELVTHIKEKATLGLVMAGVVREFFIKRDLFQFWASVPCPGIKGRKAISGQIQ